jgi:rubrerythrin
MAKQAQSKQSDAPDSNTLVPRDPETEKGQLAREQYLAFAKAALRENLSDYLALFQKYADDRSEIQQSARSLDQTVARVALQSGHSPRQVMQFLAQGPFTQYETRALSAEEKQAALPRLLHYAKRTVEVAQQQRYTEYANAVTGKIQSYADLYREHITSDLMAIQLDQKVVAAALRAGESTEAVTHLLSQGPYARFQQDVKQVSAETIEHYAKGTVAQVQSIQSLQALDSKSRAQSLER